MFVNKTTEIKVLKDHRYTCSTASAVMCDQDGATYLHNLLLQKLKQRHSRKTETKKTVNHTVVRIEC